MKDEASVSFFRYPRKIFANSMVEAGRAIRIVVTQERLGGDKEGRQRLTKYILRPPLAADRLERVEGGRVRLRLKRELTRVLRTR